jgi:teichuronic acid biosynthesis glycosyltransferase TuaC
VLEPMVKAASLNSGMVQRTMMPVPSEITEQTLNVWPHPVDSARLSMSGPSRIAIVTHWFPSSSQPHRGRPIYEISRALSKMADVRVFCIDPEYPRNEFLRPRTFVSRTGESGDAVSDVAVEYLQYPALPLITRPLNGYNCGRTLLRRLRDYRPDLVIGYDVYPEGFAAVAAAQELKIPSIVGALGSDVLRNRGYFVGKLTSQTLRKATHVLTVSDNLRERVISSGVPAERCRTIHNGCDFTIFKPSDREAARAELNIDPAAEIILFVGRLVSLKGLRELFEATATLTASRSRVNLVCIGEGPMDQELRRRASRPDLDGHVTFSSGANAHEIARWLAASNVFCLPSHSEGCPNVVIEALSCGLPVVASNVGGIPELLNSRCGILVPPKDAQQLARGLDRALDCPWNREEIAGSSQRSWEDVASETYQVCCSVVRDSRFSGR